MPTDNDVIMRLIAQDMYSDQVERAKAQIEGMSADELNHAEALIKTSEAAKDQADKLDTLGKAVVVVNQAWELGTKIVEAAKEAYDFAKEGASIQRIGEQFGQITGEMGINADVFKSKMEVAANGTVDDEVIMQAASRALTGGMVTDQAQIVKAMELARAAAVRLGGTTEERFNQIIQSSDALQSRAFKQMGVIVPPITQLVNDYAKAHGIAADSVDDDTRKQIFFQSVLEHGQSLIDKVGDTSKDAATKYEQFDVNVKELGDSFHVFASEQITPAISGLNDTFVLISNNTSATDKLKAAQDQLNSLPQGPIYDVQRLALKNLIHELANATDGVEANTKIIQSGYIPATSQATAETKDFGTVLVTEQQQLDNAKESMKLYEQSLKDIKKTYEDTAIAQEGMAVTLKDAKPVDLAKQAIKGLTDEYKAGLITQGEYQGLVQSIQLKYGLANKASVAMTTGLELLNRKFADGTITADQYQSGLAKLPKAAADGLVTLSEMGIQTVNTHLTKIEKLDADTNTAIVTAAGKNAGHMMDAQVKAEAYAHLTTIAINSIPEDRTFTLHIETDGHLPSLPGGGTPSLPAGGNSGKHTYTGQPHAGGADFIVPPGYPNDSFPLRVQSGEHVQVTPANEVGKGKSGATININTVINTNQPVTPLALAILRSQAGAWG